MRAADRPEAGTDAAARSEPMAGVQRGAARILLVDDEPLILDLLERALRAAGYRNLTATTESMRVPGALRSLRPDLILVDWHMPGIDGEKLLAAIRARLRPGAWVPVIVLTGDGSSEVRRVALAAGADEFLNKPFEAIEVGLRVSNLLATRSLHLAGRRRNRELEQKVRERTRELARAQQDIVDRLTQAVEFRDHETGGHTRRVGRLSARLATRLGLTRREVDLIRIAAPLHDIGKIAIPDRILHKVGSLSDEEFEHMKGHAESGARLLGQGTTEVLRFAEVIARSHHERWDGGGYPAGLIGEEIPMAARIVSVADFYDALASDRPYRGRWPRHNILAEIDREAGTRFDPRVAECFVEMIRTRTRSGPTTEPPPLTAVD